MSAATISTREATPGSKLKVTGASPSLYFSSQRVSLGAEPQSFSIRTRDPRYRLSVREYFGKIDGVLDAPCFGGDHLEVGRRIEAAMEMRSLLVPEVIEIIEDEPEDPQIDHGSLFERLENGQPVVIGGVVTEPCGLGS